MSAYERIKTSIGEDGRLPHGFSLEEKPAPNQIGFMPGAMDGIGVFHTCRSNEDKAVKKVVKLLKRYFRAGKERYVTDIQELLSDCRTISVVDSVLQSLRDGHRGIKLEKMFFLCLDLLKTSDHTEIIKIGISLLGLFDVGKSDEIAEVIATLALYDDFTLYAVVAAAKWTNGNRMIFRIAKSVEGWGKVHAIERLTPESDEIRQWILREGCANGVLDAYLGLPCAEKGDMISALRQESMEEDLFDGISIIIAALVGKGPASGIDEYDHAQEALLLFLNHAEKQAHSVGHLHRILGLQQWAKEAEADYGNEIIARCAAIINRPGWKEKIIDEIKGQRDRNEFFWACDAAERLDMDVSAELFAIVQAEPLQYFPYMPRLLRKPGMAAEIIEICESVLPLDEMAEGMGDYLFADKLGKEHQCLEFVLPGLAAYPLQGIKLIRTGLNSRVVRGRNMALRALSGWTEGLGKPLAEISPELCEEVARIYEIEVSEHPKEIMRKMLAGEIGPE